MNEKTFVEQLTDKYLTLIRKISMGEEGVSIQEILGTPQRQENESFEDYKERRKIEKLIVRHYMRGVRFPQLETNNNNKNKNT